MSGLCAPFCGTSQAGALANYGDIVMLGTCGGESGSNWLVPGATTAGSANVPSQIQFQNTSGGVPGHVFVKIQGDSTGPVTYGDAFNIQLAGTNQYLWGLPNSEIYQCNLGYTTLCSFFSYTAITSDIQQYFVFSIAPGYGNEAIIGGQVRYGDSITLTNTANLNDTPGFATRNPICVQNQSSCNSTATSCLEAFACGNSMVWGIPFLNNTFIPYRGTNTTEVIWTLYQGVPLGTNYQPAIQCEQVTACTNSTCGLPVCIKPGVCLTGTAKCTVVSGPNNTTVAQWSCTGGNNPVVAPSSYTAVFAISDAYRSVMGIMHPSVILPTMLGLWMMAYVSPSPTQISIICDGSDRNRIRSALALNSGSLNNILYMFVPLVSKNTSD